MVFELGLQYLFTPFRKVENIFDIRDSIDGILNTTRVIILFFMLGRFDDFLTSFSFKTGVNKFT